MRFFICSAQGPRGDRTAKGLQRRGIKMPDGASNPGAMPQRGPTGVGVGFRLKLAEELLAAETTNARFAEVAPENFLGMGGKRARLIRALSERLPVVSHGVCGDFAGAAPLDTDYLGAAQGVFARHERALVQRPPLLHPHRRRRAARPHPAAIF